MSDIQLPGLSDVFAARKRIHNLIRQTPLSKDARLSDIIGVPVYLKLVCLQRTGAFNAWGASNRLLSPTDGEKKKGVSAFSTGTHVRRGAARGAQT